MEDRELIRRIQNGEKEFLNDIAEKYYDDIYYFCCYQSGSREDSYDLAQETFLRFIRYVDHYRYRNLKGYLLTIAMNLCRTYFSGKEKETQEIFYPQKRGDLLQISVTEKMESAVILQEALSLLPQAQREAVILHYLYGYKNREIAKMTGASYAAVKSRLRRGLMELQTLLEKEDFYE